MLTLPPDQRNIENLKFREIVRKREPIEVHDSDEEIRRFDQRNKVNFNRICGLRSII